MVHSVNRPLTKVRWEGGISSPFVLRLTLDVWHIFSSDIDMEGKKSQKEMRRERRVGKESVSLTESELRLRRLQRYRQRVLSMDLPLPVFSTIIFT